MYNALLKTRAWEHILDLHPRHTDKNALHVPLLTKQNGRVEFQGWLTKKSNIYLKPTVSM